MLSLLKTARDATVRSFFWLSRTWWRLVITALIVALPVAFFLFNSDSSPIAPPAPKQAAAHFIAGSKEAARRGDVVFLHGLGGDYRATWRNEDNGFFWPEALQTDFPDIGIWSIDYDASPSEWLGGAMPINDRSKQLLERMRLDGLGKKPLVFVGHSLGGLVIKHMLRDAMTQNNQEWEIFAKKTKGVMFLATPHTGSTQATLLNLINYYMPDTSTTITVRELESNNGPLRDLNVWYRGNIPKHKIKTGVLYENLPLEILRKPRFKLLIVDECSSDPGLNDVIPVRVDATHVSIVKPESREDLVYKSTADFIRKHLVAEPRPFDISFVNFASEFNSVRSMPVLLNQFTRDHLGQSVKWQAFVHEVIPEIPDKRRASYWIIPAKDSPFADAVFATFDAGDCDSSIPQGSGIEITGIIDDGTNQNHAFIDECKIIRRLP